MLEHEIPLMKRARTARMALSLDPVVRAMLETPAARKVLRARQTSLNDTVDIVHLLLVHLTDGTLR